jgi:hypothetical protein
VLIPGYLDRVQIVTRDANDQVAVAMYDRWADSSPPDRHRRGTHSAARVEEAMPTLEECRREVLARVTDNNGILTDHPRAFQSSP